ncbi:type 1 fimbrial protein [Pseudomonas sp. SWRI79]|uniref:Type 1 fimbrial protein n=1 Tax=Pseudomonas farris TaxID=2841207 RepID=A0ABS6PZF7_9PSED|nr:type 1 fimbrial protein [Pseudomonas farris]MBV4465853.1 type 1 fimbrial protein [Pseudomonas farris]
MRNKFYSFALTGVVVASSLMSAAVFASDGTINITGALTDQTCTVTSSASVGLDSLGISAVPDGQAAGFKPFSITLSSCAASLDGKVVQAGFEPGPNTDLSTGRLNLTGPDADKAANVQLQLRNYDNSVIKIGDNTSDKGATIANSGATLNYLVGYYANGAAGAGSANSTVTYSIIYP